MTENQDPYQAIRPFHDAEVPAAVSRLLTDKAFIQSITSSQLMKLPLVLRTLARPFILPYIKHVAKDLTTVDAVQQKTCQYLTQIIDTTSAGLSVEGVNALDPKKSYLFVSNHRDIVLDPALINLCLKNNGHQTARIAIGDNLLKNPTATDLMKLNKSFIVNRSTEITRERIQALAQLSGYIKHSLETNNSIWIAQREGRAKDGQDHTDPAILKMLYMEGKKRNVSFQEYMQSLHIVPVAISYENDPCDSLKACELSKIAKRRKYKKSDTEDVDNMVKGITGWKGRMHIYFGSIIGDKKSTETPQALAQAIDKKIQKMYQFYPIHHLAANHAHISVTDHTRRTFEKKKRGLNSSEKHFLTEMYANPVRNQLIHQPWEAATKK